MNDMTKLPERLPGELHLSDCPPAQMASLAYVATAIYAAMITHHGAYVAEHSSMERLAVEHARRLMAQVDEVGLP